MRASSKETLIELLSRLGLIVGYDEDKEGDGGGSEDSENEDDGNESDEDDGEEDEEDGDKDKEASALREALRKERRDRKKIERERNRLQKEKEREADKDTNDAVQARKDADEARATNERLANKLRETATDNVITKLATKMKFRDVDDALKLVDRNSLDVDQDQDNPDDIDIDEKSVQDALNALTKSKPHLLLADGDSGPSGGNLGSRSNNKGGLDEQALMDKYPALRRGAPAQS